MSAPPTAARGSSLVAAGILLSRVAGLVREKAIVYYLGSGLAVEAFRAALRIPNLLQNLLGEGVLSASLIPVYTRLRADGRDEEAGQVAGAVAGLLVVVAGLLVLVGVLLAGPLTTVLAAGFTGERRELTIRLVRILTPGIGFLVLSAWCLGVLNSHRSFFLPYVAPVLWNAAMVAALVVGGLRGLAGTSLVTALAWGTVAGGVAQLAVQVPAVRRLAPGIRVSVRVDLDGVRRVVRALGPVIGSRGVVQLLAYVTLLLTSFLAPGAFASLALAQVLYLLPISLFGMSVAAADLPELASASRDPADREVVARRLEAGLSRIAFFVVPTILAYVVLGDVVVGVLFQGGAFERIDTLQVWAVLAAYTPGLLATTSSRLLQSALYGVEDTRTPALAAVVRVGIAVCLEGLLMLQLDAFALRDGGVVRIAALPSFAVAPEAVRAAADNAYRLGAAGLALGAGASAWVEYGLLRRAVERRVAPVRRDRGVLLRVAVAGGAAVAVGAALRHLLAGAGPVLGGLPVLLAAGATYLGLAAALGVPEVAVVTRRLRRR